ncbi:hypothetical protein Tco_1246650 [Tanacetum coccineum]
MSSASSAVTYTSVYTDLEPGRVFWGADEEISDGGIPRVIVLGYDGLLMQPAHDPDYVPEHIYPEYIPLEDEHEFSAEDLPLPPVDSPTAESPEYVTESDPEEDPKEYEDDEIEMGLVDYPMDGGDDRDDDDGDSSRDDVNDEDEDEDEEDEEEEEHLAPSDSAGGGGASFPSSEAEGERTSSHDYSSPSPPLLTYLHPLQEGLAREWPHMHIHYHHQFLPPFYHHLGVRQIQTSGLPLIGPLLLQILKIGGVLLADLFGDRGVDYGFVSTVDAEARRQGISEVGYGIRDTWDLYALLEDAQDSRPRISQRVDMDSQRVDLLMGDRMTLQETVWMVEEEAYCNTPKNMSQRKECASSKLVKECSLNSETKDVHAIKYKMSKAKERCMAYFRSLHSHLQVLSKDDLKGTRIEHGFKRAFMSLFGQDVDTFTRTMLLNVDQLQKQLDKDEFQEDGSMTAFWVVNNQFQKFIDSKFTLDYDSQMTDTYFVEYTGLEMQTQASKIDTGKALDADLVDTESIRTNSTVQDDSSRSGNDTDADDADIRPIYDEEPMTEVQLTAECNIFAIGQQHTEQPEIIVEGRVGQYPEPCQVKSPMLDSSPDNQTTECSKQSLESKNILLKETVAQFQKDFSRMEAHCIALELKYQNQSLKSGQHGQILNKTSNKAKIEKEICKT